MPDTSDSSPVSSLPGRGVAMRFHALDELGPAPTSAPTPPTPVSSVPPPSAVEGDLPFLTISQAAPLIRDGKLSPVDLTTALLARIERLNPLLNAYITVTPEVALQQAREAEAEIKAGNYRGPLHGIPIALKDLVATAGVLTTGGTGALSDWIPAEDAVIWSLLRQSGAVLLGKLGLHEMAAGFTNLNPFYGATRNPWDTNRITGGSSGGSGAAVAAHMCLAAIGSDTAGSIRVPSALCGITGLKPTFGRVSTRGALYLSWTRDHLGPMTKTAQDAALIMNAISGFDSMNPLSVPSPDEDFGRGMNSDLTGVRLAVPSNYFWEFEPVTSPDSVQLGPGLDPEVASSVRAAIETLRSLGVTIEEIEIDGMDAMRDNVASFNVERAFFVEQLPPERRALFDARYRDGVVQGLETPAAAYLRSLHTAHSVQVALETAMQGYDALVAPTSPITAPTIDSVASAMTQAAEAATAAKERGEAPPRAGGPTAPIGRNTSPFNQSGQPALTVPCGLAGNGLPIGMMIVGNRFADATALRIGHAYQQATNWHTRRPPVDG